MFRAAFRFNVFVSAVLLAAASGCSFMDPFETKDSMPPPSVNEMLAYCYDGIYVATDKVNGERPMPGLVGQVYLASGGLKSTMVEANGVIHVDLYDMTPGVQPHKLVDWTFDKESLKALKRPDKFGLGYTLFLPWETYNPEIKKVQVQMSYLEPGKQTRYGDSQIIAIKTPGEKAPAAPVVQQINLSNVPIQRTGATMMPTN
jgi:hypothetical protein